MAADIKKEKLKALQLTIDKIEKAYGKGAVMKLDDSVVEGVEVIVNRRHVDSPVRGYGRRTINAISGFITPQKGAG